MGLTERSTEETEGYLHNFTVSDKNTHKAQYFGHVWDVNPKQDRRWDPPTGWVFPLLC